MRRGDFDDFLTARIAAERLQPQHTELIHRMHQSDDVMANLGGRRCLQETQAYMGHNLAHWQTYGFGIWILRENATGRFMGRGGLRHTVLEDNPEVEVAYGLLPEFWNQGLATEFTKRLVQIGSVGFGLTELVSVTLSVNVPSRRVLEKAAFRYERRVMFKAQTHLLYRWRCPIAETPEVIRT